MPSSSILIGAAPKETPLLGKDGRISEIWLSWFASITSTGAVVQAVQTLQTVAEDNSTDANTAAILAEVLDALALQAEPRRAPERADEVPADPDNFAWRAEADELRALIVAEGPSDPMGAAASALALSLQSANNLSDVASASTSLANLIGSWQNWTPTATTNGVTLTGLSISDAQYLRVGSLVHFKVNVSFTLSGTPSTNVSLSLPVNAAGNLSAVPMYIQQAGSSNWSGALGFVYAVPQTIVAAPFAGANWPTGTGAILASGAYRVS